MKDAHCNPRMPGLSLWTEYRWFLMFLLTIISNLLASRCFLLARQGTVWKPAVLTLWASFEDIPQHIHFQQQEVVRTTLLVLWSYISYKFFSARGWHQWDLWFGDTHWCFTIPDAFSTPPGEQISGKVGKEHLGGDVQCPIPVRLYYSHEIVTITLFNFVICND